MKRNFDFVWRKDWWCLQHRLILSIYGNLKLYHISANNLANFDRLITRKSSNILQYDYHMGKPS
jgi:hypothetical protein